MATTWPRRLERLDDPQLVLGRDAGEDGGLGGDAPPALVVQALELAGVHGLQRVAPGVAVQAELAGDLGGGRRLVAGDHRRCGCPPRRQVAIAALASSRSGSIMPTSPTKVIVAGQVLLAVPVGQVAAGQGQDAQGARGQLLVGSR